MAKDTLMFKCPICDGLALIEKLTSESKSNFDIVNKATGGKVKFTEAEKILMHGLKPKRGSGHGKIRYTSQGAAMLEVYRPMLITKLREALSVLIAQEEEAKKL
jgi:hypothetical protein